MDSEPPTGRVIRIAPDEELAHRVGGDVGDVQPGRRASPYQLTKPSSPVYPNLLCVKTRSRRVSLKESAFSNVNGLDFDTSAST